MGHTRGASALESITTFDAYSSPCTKPRGRSAPGEAVVERARPEHRSERDRVDPDGEPLEVSVRQDDERYACDDRCYERVLMEHAA